jgi:hypothetical protein
MLQRQLPPSSVSSIPFHRFRSVEGDRATLSPPVSQYKQKLHGSGTAK